MAPSTGKVTIKIFNAIPTKQDEQCKSGQKRQYKIVTVASSMAGLSIGKSPRELIMASIPAAPKTMANIDLHQTLTDVITFLRDVHENGLKFISFTQTQIDNLTDLSYQGTVVYNTTTEEPNTSYLDGGILKWRAF